TTKKTKKNLLKQQYGNFKAEGSKTLEQTFNRLQVIVGQLQFMDVEIEQDDLNQKFLTSLALEWLMHTIVWRNMSVLDTMSLDDLYNHLKDINQIDEDDMEEMDIKWNMAVLSMRADKFWKKTWKKISIQGSDVAGFDNSKVECFNCHKMGYFARECRAPRSQGRGRRDNYRHGSKAKEQAPKALMAIDEVGWDWSYKANDEERSCIGLAQVESRLVGYKEREVKYYKKIKTLDFRNRSNNECIEILKKKIKTLKQEKEGVDGKLPGLLTASKNIDNVIESQRSDKNKDGLGYSVVPPPPAQLYSSFKKDLSWTGLPEFADDTITDYSRPLPTIESTSGDDQNRNPSVSKNVASPITPNPFIKFVKQKDTQSKSKTDETKTPKKPPVKYAEQYKKPNKKPNVRGNQRNWNNLKSQQLGPDFVMKKKAYFNCGDFNHLAYDCRKRVKKSFTPKLVAHRPYRPLVRLVRTNMNDERPNRTSFNKEAHSYANRPFNRTSAVRSHYRAPWVPTVNRNFPPVNRKFYTSSRNFPTTNRKFPTASRKFPARSLKCFTADMGIKGKAVKPSACWFWKPSHNLSNKGLNNNSVSVMFKKYTYIDTQARLKSDSGCSRHMTDNISYLSDYEQFDEGYVCFGQGGCKVTGNGTIKIGKLEFENVYFVKDLKTPRQHNMYSIDLNNIVPHRDLTSLVAKASTDECMLWHRRLGHLNFKTMNKLVRHNLVRGLPTKCFENDHTCIGCLKGKQHKASCTKDATSQEVKKDASSLRYIALPNWAHDALLEFSSSKPKDHCSTEVPEGSGNPNPIASMSYPPADQMEILTAETPIPTVSSPVPTTYSTESQEPSSDARLISKRVANQEETPSLDNILSMTNQFEDILKVTTNSDESNGVEANISNMETSIIASPTPTLRIYKDHPKSQIIGPLDTPNLEQVQRGNDYDEVFAPVARTEAIRLFLAYASFMRFTVYQMDVKSAFLYDTIDEEVAMGELNFFLGLQVLQKEDGIFLLQDKYIGDILKKFGYSDVRSSNTPMDKENPWGKDGTGKDVDLHLYRSMIRSLMYLTASRLDIMFAVCACARHQVTPKECHLCVVKRIFRYLKGHPNLGPWYPKESSFDLVVYSDSDYGGATQDRKSTTGGC
nr:hypothetical protein [Tanacetum cinerariifolium]